MTKVETPSVEPFEHRAELFKNAVERAAKKYFVTLNCGYLQSWHDEHVVIIDKFDDDNKVYYNTLTRDE